MYEGEVVQIGTPQELFERPAHTFVGYFIGSPGMNLLPADGRGPRRRGSTAAPIALGARLPASRRHGARSRSASGPNSSRIAAAGDGRCRSRSQRVEDLGNTRSCRARARRHPRSRPSARRGRAVADRARRAWRFDPARIHLYADGRLRRRGRRRWTRPATTRAWLLVLPVFVLVGVPRGHPADDGGQLLGPGHLRHQPFFWTASTGSTSCSIPRRLGGRFFAALAAQAGLLAIILAIEIPLGIGVALAMPRAAGRVAVYLVAHGAAAADPVERRRHDLADLRAAPTSACSAALSTTLGLNYNYTADPFDAWITIVVMDVWHWTALVALLCYAGLGRSPTPTTRRPRSTARRAGRCSATSSCRRCAACC